MKDGIRQSMAWLHTWTGLIFGWLLYVIFLCGTISYWQEEITRWMQPEVTVMADPAMSIDGAMRYLSKAAPDAKNWYITPPNSRSAITGISWEPSHETPSAVTEATLDGSGVPIHARETRGGNFLYRLHYDLYAVPISFARYLVGIAAMLMLIALISGIIIHKKIFANFFFLRFGKGQRSWLDAHNITSVLALPFHLMITYTGLVTLATLYMPWAVAANYASVDDFYAAAYPRTTTESTGHPAPLIPFSVIATRFPQGKSQGRIKYVEVRNPGDVAARITVTASKSASMDAGGDTYEFSGVTGKAIAQPSVKGGAVLTESVMIGLHTGRYAGIVLRWLYFLSGIAGTAMIATGLVLWTVKRQKNLLDPEKPHLGFRIVERLNIAVIAGFPGAVAVYFVANRLLPTAMSHRAEWEIRCMFLTLAAAFVFACFRPVRRAWIETLAISGLLFSAVVVVDAVTSSRWLLPSLRDGDWVFVGFDAVMLITSAAFGIAASTAGRPAKLKAPRRQPGRRQAAA
ncbi:MAG: peptidase [Sphingomonadales bacterium]|nr:peptidase [Sphingomonadales bacterium]